MSKIDFFLLPLSVFFIICPFAGSSSKSDDSFALKGATVYTVSSPKILNATFLVENVKILAVGKDVKIQEPKGAFSVDKRNKRQGHRSGFPP